MWFAKEQEYVKETQLEGIDSDDEEEEEKTTEEAAQSLLDLKQELDLRYRMDLLWCWCLLISAEMCQNIGHMCKLLIDYGREQYINSLHKVSSNDPSLTLKAKLVKYCPREDSPENRLLLASYV